MVDFVQHDSATVAVVTRAESEESLVGSVVDAVESSPADDVATVGDDSGVGSLPPLYEAIDADALEALYGHVRNHPASVDWATTFRYAAHDVTVSSAGDVTVAPAQSAPRSRRKHACPSCEDGGVSVAQDDAVVDATFECPECGHSWNVSF